MLENRHEWTNLMKYITKWSAADFRKGGSAELYREGQGWRIVWAQPLRGQRPWTVSDSGG